LDQNKYFREELTKLNKEQFDAVDTIEGPVLVVAGPGTGKTHILASRIGNILLKAQVDPHNILCLTYTDAGVQAMRQRLISLIGVDAHKVHIFTYHAFCSNIIRSNPDYFGIVEAEPIEKLDRFALITKLLADLPAGHILRKAYNPQHHVAQLEWLFGVMKREEWPPEKIELSIKTYLDDLPYREEFIYKRASGKYKKGDVKEADIQELTQKMATLSAASMLFEPYQKALTEKGQYDFDDMIAWVIDAFAKHEFLLRRYQEQYNYFLIDEYQDTNGSQDHILRQLYSFWGDSANIFIVGDDDQAIYEFQGAKLEHLTDFYARFEANLKLVVLKKNYRSSQNILDASHALIENNQERLVNHFKGNTSKFDKKLVAEHEDFAKSKTKPQVAVYENNLHEISDVVAQIQALKAQNVPLNEIAVLYCKHQHAEALTKLLEKSGIPYNTKRKLNILSQPIVLQLLTMLKYVAAETILPFSAEADLFKILHFPYFNVSVADIALLSFYKIKCERKLNDNIETEQNDLLQMSWRILIADEAALEEAGIKNIAPFTKVAAFLDALLRAKHTAPLQTLLEIVINQSGLLSHVMQQKDKIWLLEVLQSFSSFVKNKILQQPDYQLETLLNSLDQMSVQQISIDLQKNILVNNGVMLSTAHGAKGLEFEYVFVINAINTGWEAAKQNNSSKFKLPDTLTQSKVTDEDKNNIEGIRRLFFVAMTRAKHFLQISYSKQNETGKDQIPSLFLSEIKDYVSTINKEINVDQLIDIQRLTLSETAVSYPEIVHEALIKQRVQELVFSATSLSHYWDCPLGFYLQDVLRMPGTNSAAAMYGTAIHNALYQYFRTMTREKNIFPSVSYLTDVFRKEMKKREYFFEAPIYEQYMAEGVQNLFEYYNSNHEKWNTSVELEVFVHNVMLGNMPVKGTIDKIEIIGQNVAKIVDYKTGKFDTKKIAKRSKKENGSRYWNQLLFYKLLYEQRFPMTTIKESAIDFVTEDTKGKNLVNVEFSDDDVTWMRARLAETHNRILDLDFYTGCGGKGCQWCNFVKNSTTPTRFDNSIKEDLDDGGGAARYLAD
jgi:DNA helicase II / ATP-dependent DNA helicase PcrA